MIEQILAYGGEINKVELREYAPGVNGMVATEDIYKGDLVAYIPREFFITHIEAEESATVKYLDEHNIWENIKEQSKI